jgi:transcriptional antiterminator RfaH
MNLTEDTLTEVPPQWFVVRTVNRQETLARYSLQADKVEVYLPVYLHSNHKGETFGRPLFPNHLFVRLGLGAPGWTSVFSARGVNCVLGCGGRPTPIADRVIRDIKAREAEGFVRMRLAEQAAPCRFKPGDAVSVKKGPFANIEAVFLEVVDKNRVLVLIQLLGESPRIAKADLAQLESRADTANPTRHLAPS